MSITISFLTEGEKLIPTSKPVIASGDRDTVTISVAFDSSWDGYAKSGVFLKKCDKDHNVYEAIMDSNNSCIIPHEALDEAGTTYIGVRGVNGATVYTSSLVAYRIDPGAPEGTTATVPPTASVYQQLLTANAVLSSRVDEIASLPEGGTSGDAELRDIRVKADGSTASTAGNAVREQVSSLSESITEFQEGISTKHVSPNMANGHWNAGYMNNTQGRVVDDGTGAYGHTDRIPTNSASYITLTSDNPNESRVRINNQARFITAFDSNGNLLPDKGYGIVGTIGNVKTEGVTKIPLDASVAYIVVTITRPSDHPNFMLCLDDEQTEYEAYGAVKYTIKEECLPTFDTTIEKTLYKYLNGKSIAVYGDSIMQGTGNNEVSPVEMLAEKYGMTCYKYTRNGACMGIRADQTARAYHIGYQVADSIGTTASPLITPDFIVFDGGTNDQNATSLGDFSKDYAMPSDESNFSSGFDAVAYQIKNTWKNAKVVFIRVHNMASRTYDNQIAFGERGIQISEKWAFDVIDVFKKMNTQLSAYSEYLADYTHPNELGYNTFYIPALEKWLYENRPSEF